MLPFKTGGCIHLLDGGDPAGTEGLTEKGQTTA